MERMADATATDIYCLMHAQGAAVTRQQAQILHALRMGTVTPYERIEDALWGDDPDGGPEGDTKNLVRVQVHRLRRLGFKIVAHYNVGYQWKGSK